MKSVYCHIQGLVSDNEQEVADALDCMDSCGILIGPNESLVNFRKRIEKLLRELDEIRGGTSRFKDIYAGADYIEENLRSAAADMVWNFYKFRPDWIPAWVSKKHTGVFSEGILYEIDGFLPAIFLQKGGTLRSAEILAHEMCHAAKMPYPDSVYEEWFPRYVESSKFRRIFGNFFRRWQIPALAIASLVACAVLFILRMPVFGILALVPAAALILREIALRERLLRVRNMLCKSGYDPLPIMFRMDDNELSLLAKSHNPKQWIEDMSKSSYRWKMYKIKFAKRQS